MNGERHIATQCDECLAVDDHPKLHYGAATMHHDCASPSIRRDVLGDVSAHSVSNAATAAAFDGADKGLRGDELREHIRAVQKREAAKLARAAGQES